MAALADTGRPRVAESSPGAEREKNAVLAGNWWAIALRGVLGIAFGVIAFIWPGGTMLSLLLFFSAYAFVDGIFAVVAAVRAARSGRRWGLFILEGLVNIATALVALAWPAITILAFVFLMAAWALVSGALMLAAAFRLRTDHGRWWLAFGGVVSILFGVALAVAPLVGAVVLTWWVGAYAFVFGVALLVLAFQLRSRHETHPGNAVLQGG